MKFEDTFIGRPNTIQTYQSLFKNHIAPHVFSNEDWSAWDENLTIKALKIWDEKKLSKQTQKSLLKLLSRYIEFKGGPKIETKRFIRGLDRANQDVEVNALSIDQAERIMDTCERVAPKFYPILLLALHGGLRRGEIFGLRCSDVDMIKGRIRVAHSYDGPTKTGKTRYVPMSNELSRVLVGARNLLFRGTNEKVFEKLDPNPILKRLCAKAEIPVIRFHDLRHSFATMALESGVSPRQVQAWLGHSSVATTLGIYWNLTGEETDLNFLPVNGG